MKSVGIMEQNQQNCIQYHPRSHLISSMFNSMLEAIRLTKTSFLKISISILFRGGKTTHILYLSKSTDTCVRKDPGKSRSTDSTPLLK